MSGLASSGLAKPGLLVARCGMAGMGRDGAVSSDEVWQAW